MEAAVEDAVANAQRKDKEWRRQAARLRQEEKRREKLIAKAAKRALAQMKKQARAARKAQAKAQKLAKKQGNAVRKVQKRELKIERKRVKTIAKLRRSNEKRRKRMVRKHQKEERRRRKRMQAQDALPLESEVSVVAEMQPGLAATLVPLEAPAFKENKCCKSCNSKFSKLPTRRRHHCRNCGESFCSKCLSGTKRPIPWFQLDKPQKVCFSCDVQVFNGMGGAATNSHSAESSMAVTTPPTSNTNRSEVSQVQPPSSAHHQSPLRVQRSASFQSEQPEDSPRTASPPSSSRSGLSFRLRPRATRDGTTAPKSKKSSRWTLPIRPLLKRKASADQLRNRTWDLDLRIEKEAMLARQRQSQMLQFATAT